MSLMIKKKPPVIDPVCGMEVKPGVSGITGEVDGETYFFCAERCRESFLNDPQKYLCTKPARKRGIWGRYLARLEKASGGKPMKCH